MGQRGPCCSQGRRCAAGSLGRRPDLANLDIGDLKYTVDFRDVYATLLRRWLAVDAVSILGQRNEGLPIV